VYLTKQLKEKIGWVVKFKYTNPINLQLFTMFRTLQVKCKRRFLLFLVKLTIPFKAFNTYKLVDISSYLENLKSEPTIISLQYNHRTFPESITLKGKDKQPRRSKLASSSPTERTQPSSIGTSIGLSNQRNSDHKSWQKALWVINHWFYYPKYLKVNDN